MPIKKIRPTFTFDEDRLAELEEVVPEAFADGRVNWEVLREGLGDYLEDADEETERFGLFWPGKREARRLASMPSSGALVPQPGLGVNEESANHVFIEGENLEVLKLMQKSYANCVKMIYIDPPYNTGNDFIYADDYSEPLQSYLRRTGQADEEGRRLTTNTRASGRFHSNWLSMMYPRLLLARQFLTEDGFICVSIGEEEMPNLRLLLNEVFGEENYRNSVLVRRYNKNINVQFIEKGLTTLNVGAEYVLVYARSQEASLNAVYREASEERQKHGYWKGFWNSADRPTMRYELLGVKPETGQWKWGKEKALEAVQNYREYTEEFQDEMSLEEYWRRTGREKRFIRRNLSGTGMNQGVEHWISPTEGYLRSSNWTDILASDTLSDLGLEYDNPKNVELIKELIRMCSSEEALILDFFAGSCTTSQATMEINREEGGNRRFICVEYPMKLDPVQKLEEGKSLRTTSAVGRERIRRVINQMKAEVDGQLDWRPEQGLGFRCYSLGRSNYEHWEDITTPDVMQVEMAFDRFETPLVEDWQHNDLFTEILLIEGFPLDSTVTRKELFRQNQVDLVTSDFHQHRLLICLDDSIGSETIAQLDLADTDVFVCLDSALSDEAKVRLSDTGNIHVI